jgi:hypothetical protein
VFPLALNILDTLRKFGMIALDSDDVIADLSGKLLVLLHVLFNHVLHYLAVLIETAHLNLHLQLYHLIKGAVVLYNASTIIPLKCTGAPLGH